MFRVLFASFCLVVCVLTWLLMGVSLCLLTHFPPDAQVPDRIQIGLRDSVKGDVLIGSTILCTLNALSQYGFRHAIRRIMEEDDPNPRGGVRWMRALQSVVIAWGIWFATLIGHCLR